MALEVTLHEGLDFTGPEFAGKLHTILVQASWALASTRAKDFSSPDASIVMRSACVVHLNLPRSKDLVIQCMVPPESSERDRIQLKCDVVDIDKAPVASLDVCYGILPGGTSLAFYKTS